MVKGSIISSKENILSVFLYDQHLRIFILFEVCHLISKDLVFGSININFMLSISILEAQV